MSALAHYRKLQARVDAFFQRVAARYGDEMDCATGCTDCCQTRFSVTSVEAAVLQAAALELPETTRRRLVERARADGPACPALEEDGRCALYEARPLVCRSHGVAIRFPAQDHRRHLPVVDACPRNFQHRDLADLDPDCVLNQETLSMTLAAVDHAYAAETGRPPERIEMEELLAGLG